MPIEWKYERDDSKAAPLEPGDYRICIEEAEGRKSKTGKDMISIKFRVGNGSNSVIYHNIVKGDYFNRNMTNFFDSFPEVGDGNFDFITWTGAMGAARLRHEQGSDYLKIWYFLSPKQSENLPEWKGDKPEKVEITELEEGNPFTDEDLW